MRRGWLLFLCAIWSSWVFATPSHTYSLKNGLQLIVKEDHRAPVVFFSVWYKVGSGYESDGSTGVAHVLEHMMFRGTQRYPAGMLEKIISTHGGQQNAMTAEDWTVYFQLLNVNALAVSFQLESDRMQHLLLTPSDFKKEIQVVMEERRMRVEDDPEALTYERLMAAAQVNNPYHHPTVGWMTDLQHLNVSDVHEWYHHWYAPNNAVIIVIGDVTFKEVRALTEQYFAPIPARPLPDMKPRVEIEALGAKQVEVHRPATVPTLLMGYKVPSMVTAKNKTTVYALSLLGMLLGGYDSARFGQHLVRGKEIASTVQVMYDFVRLHGTQFIIEGIPMSGHSIDELRQAIVREITQLQDHGVSEAELKRAKTQLIAQHIYKKDSLMAQALDIGIPVSVGLPLDFEEQYMKAVQEITAQQVQAAARQYLTNMRLTIGVLDPIHHQPVSTMSKVHKQVK